MGYDILGTFSRSQWNNLSAFFVSALEVIEEKYNSSDERSIFLKHILAEIAKAQLEYDHLERALANFNNFKGDFPVKKELNMPDPNKQITRFALSDTDTSVTVDTMKTPITQVLKRKKDNLEYRFKKIFDLIDQMENKFLVYSNYRQILAEGISTVESHFTDGFHTHNLREDAIFNADGFIDHGLDQSIVQREEDSGWLGNPDKREGYA